MTKNKEKKDHKALLLIAILVLMIAISSVFAGTLAKYLTSNTVSDEAAVAKFGLGIPGTINLFSDSYTNVQADEEGKKIIAPGTEGSYKFSVTGTSEVAYKVIADIAVTYSDEWDGYEPLKFSIDGLNWTDFTEFEANLSAALSSAVMLPNSPYASTQTIYWKWLFYVSDGNDIKDTNMGNLASEGSAPSVSVDIEVTAAQVD